MDELVIGDQKYISSKRAAQLTGYAKDYIGQLCREGRVEARLVGRSWYVREAAIKDHRFGAENASGEHDVKQAVAEEAPYQGPTYEAISGPEIIPMINETEEAPDPGHQDDITARMQSAWQEWFKKGENEETKDKPLEPEKEPREEETVPISKIPESIEEPVAITKVAEDEPVVAKEEQIIIVKKEAKEPVEAPKQVIEDIKRPQPTVPTSSTLSLAKDIGAQPSYKWLKISLIILGALFGLMALIGSGSFGTTGLSGYFGGVKTISK